MRFTRLGQQAVIMMTDAVSAVRRLVGGKLFLCIFMDSSYNKKLELDVLEALIGTTLVDRDTLIVVEASLETTWESVEELGYEIVKEKRYKTNQHLFLKKGGER